ncbi:MAG: alpha/beta hydrolase-fold protein [Longimicrobiales bacterium]
MGGVSKTIGIALMVAATRPGMSTAQQPATGFLDRSVTVDGRTYAYQVYVPRSYDGGEAWPVILFLHGAGERGADGLIQTEVGLGSAVRRAPESYPAIIVFPQVPLEETWQGDAGRAALAALDQTLAEFDTDPSRVYLTGMSMGGNGTWYLAYHHPERFAALAVVCGFVSGLASFGSFLPEAERSRFERLAERIRDLPVWIVHGEADPAVPVSESRAMHAALDAAGAAVHYVELTGVGHNAWDPAYRSSELPAWLFAQRRP